MKNSNKAQEQPYKGVIRAEEILVSVKDVPSPIDFRDRTDAKEWAQSALQKRPDRPVFFDKFAQEISAHRSIERVLELGSGPGFLIAHLLERTHVKEYVALDFSAAMHELARTHLRGSNGRVSFIERNFKVRGWTAGLEKFDCVVTNQSVHELRHKSYASKLHSEVRDLLRDKGVYLVNDHFAGSDGMSNNELYMTKEEHKEAMLAAGFAEVTALLTQSKMLLLRAVK
ncbi:MAG: class I SAM-dependent methyltransferase [Proteobacteria bacterium]|nr:class I SAM-dependent methyltransferase [Pseudomonadota bacterium]